MNTTGYDDALTLPTEANLTAALRANAAEIARLAEALRRAEAERDAARIERNTARNFTKHLLVVMNTIAYEPIGHSEASHREVLDKITEMARKVLYDATHEKAVLSREKELEILLDDARADAERLADIADEMTRSYHDANHDGALIDYDRCTLPACVLTCASLAAHRGLGKGSAEQGVTP